MEQTILLSAIFQKILKKFSYYKLPKELLETMKINKSGQIWLHTMIHIQIWRSCFGGRVKKIISHIKNLKADWKIHFNQTNSILWMRKNAFRNAKATKTDTLLRVRYEIYVSMLRFHFYDGAKIFLRQYITTIMNFNQMNSSLYIP